MYMNFHPFAPGFLNSQQTEIEETSVPMLFEP